MDALKERDLQCYKGSIGSLVDVENPSEYSEHLCLPNHEFPPNLHEYDIVIVDLQGPSRVAYSEEDHTRTRAKGHVQRALLSCYPETVFDPRGLASTILKPHIGEFMSKDALLIVFAAQQETIEYHPVAITSNGYHRDKTFQASLYDFCPATPRYSNRVGRDTIAAVKAGTELASLLARYNEQMSYSIAFSHPQVWDNNRQVKDRSFFPLIEASAGGVVAFFWIDGPAATFFFPHIREKTQFLIELIERALPEFAPKVFPFSTQFVWLSEPRYMLPNEASLRQERAELKEIYEANLAAVEERIEANRIEHGFLHDLLTKSGQELVNAVHAFFAWLGFSSVVNVDEEEPALREEDLRLETDRGALVVEVKGIGGTSTDSDCAQIGKIKYRRSRERGKFDVFALYVVNHQRYLPPRERLNPPFNPTQIQDAKDDERGLVTTYDLFNLYFNVENGFVSKNDARAALFSVGLVQFLPADAVRVPTPLELHHNGQVVIVQADGLAVRVGEAALVSDKGKYRPVQMMEIQVDGTSVQEVHAGEVGVKLSKRLGKETELWLTSAS